MHDYRKGERVWVCIVGSRFRARVVDVLSDGVRVHIGGQGPLLSRAEFRGENLRLVSRSQDDLEIIA